MENILIDVKNKLKPKDIAKFREQLNEDTNIDIIVEKAAIAYSVTNKELRTFFENQEAVELIKDNNDVISFVALIDDATIALEISGADFIWWTGTFRKKQFGRLDELFNVEKTVKTRTDNSKTYQIAAGKLVDNEIKDIQYASGKKADLIGFINKYYSKSILQNNFVDNVVFAFYNDIADLSVRTNWSSLKELKEKGIVE